MSGDVRRVVPATGRPALRTRARRAAWRRLRRAWYLLAQRKRHDRLVVECVAGRPILVLSGVFNPKLLRTGEILAKAVEASVRPGAWVLDLGTGSGIVAVFAARNTERVVAVDVNPMAVRCARANALVQGVEHRIDVRLGDMFDAVQGETFDLVAFNPPYLRGEPRDNLDRAFRAGDVPERFAAGLADHLAPGGRAIIVLSTDGRGDELLAMLAAQGFHTTPISSHDLRSEVVTVWNVTVGSDP